MAKPARTTNGHGLIAAAHQTARIRTELVTVTPAMARALRDACAYERQRPLSDSHITRLATEVGKGRFIEGTQVHFCVLKGQPMIVHGNHTLESIAKGTQSVALSFLYTEVSSLEEAGRIYARHDIHRARDWLAAIRGAGMTETLDVPKEIIKGYGAAMKIILSRFRSIDTRGGRGGADRIEIMTSRDLRLAAMREYAVYLELFATATAKGSKSAVALIRKSGVLAAALETFKYQPSAAAEFWSGVAADDGLRKGDPRKALLNWLRPMVGKQGNAGIQDQLAKASAKASAKAWNAAYAKERVDLMRVHQSIPFVLSGTPWGSKDEPNLKRDLDARSTPRPTLVKLVETPPAPPKYMELGVRIGRGGSKEAVAVAV